MRCCRCTVQRVEAESSRLTATFKRTIVPACTSGLFVQTLLLEGVAAAQAASDLDDEGADSEQKAVAAAGRPLPDFTQFPVGCTRDATVVKV